jgi:hypothetical protein
MLNLKKLFMTFQDSFDADGGLEQTVAEYIAERYDEVLSLQRDLKMLDRAEQEAIDAHEAKLREIYGRRQHIQCACTHPSTTYHPDASGNNDSHTECDICGVEI